MTIEANEKNANLSKNAKDLETSIFTTKSMESNFLISNKELSSGLNELLSKRLETIQNGIIGFCRNTNNLQKAESYYSMNFGQQMNFNECIIKVSDKLRLDMSVLEDFYSNCKSNCLQDEEEKEKLKKYLDSSNSLIKKTIPPCIYSCRKLYYSYQNKYINYMVVDNGIYIECSDYKKWEEKL
jgi:hypothetical protein